MPAIDDDMKNHMMGNGSCTTVRQLDNAVFRAEENLLSMQKVRIVIQCAGSKDLAAPTLSRHGTELKFVAYPKIVHSNECAPWDEIPGLDGNTWIDCVRNYNDKKTLPPGIAVSNGQNLTRAGSLYRRSIYQKLINSVGSHNVYILSAGWGLVYTDDKIPSYDITFSSSVKIPKDARITSAVRTNYDTVRQIIDGDEDIHLFITAEYAMYWMSLFPGMGGRCVVLHWRQGQATPLGWAGQTFFHNCGSCKTNWHYIAAKQFCLSMRSQPKTP
jgi:hypothetical protein